MSKQVKIWLAIVLVALAAGAFLVVQQPWKSEAGPVRVAGNLPLTGPAAAFSGQYPNGFRLGIEEAAASRQLDPNLFRLDFQDNAFDTSKSVSILQQQAAQGFDVYVSGLTPTALAVSPQVSPTGKAHFAIAFDAFITREFSNVFRVLPHFKAEGPLWGKYARHRGAKRVFLLHSNFSAYHEEYTQIIEPDLQTAGIEFQREVFELGAGTDALRAIALKVQDFAPDLIFISSLSPDLLPLIEALRQRGLGGDGAIMTTLDFTDLLYGDVDRARLMGVAFACPDFELSTNRRRHEPWRQRYEQRFGRWPGYVEAYAYDTAGILMAAYAAQGGVSPDQIRGVMPYEGITGTIRLDKDNDLVGTLTVATLSAAGDVVEIHFQ